MLQYKVPQDVQMADKIVGPLTMRQLIICGIGFGIAYVIYISLAKKYYWETWIWPVALVVLITSAIAFLKIKHIPFIKWVFLILEASINPRKRLWNKSESTQFVFATVKIQTSKEKKAETEKLDIKTEKVESKEDKLSHLEELTQQLNTNNFLDEKAAGRIDKTEDHHLSVAAIHQADDQQRHENRLNNLLQTK